MPHENIKSQRREFVGWPTLKSTDESPTEVAGDNSSIVEDIMTEVGSSAAVAKTSSKQMQVRSTPYKHCKRS